MTLEAASGLSGPGSGLTSFQGKALGHFEYEQAGAERKHHFYASFLALAGTGPTEKILGDFLAASNIEGYRSVRLYAWWYETEASEWSFRIGALLADDEFTGTNAGGNLCNSVFGWPVFISANTVNTGPAFFVAAPGLRLQRSWGEKAAWRLGIYDGDTFDSPTGDGRSTRHGVHYRIGGNQGWFLISEVAFTPGSAATRVKLGGWLHTADFADMQFDTNGLPLATTGGSPRQHSHNFGAYFTLEHTLAGTTGKAGDIESFLRMGAAPDDRNTIGWAIDTGVSWTGPIPSRPGDIAILGVAHAAFSRDFRTNARATSPTLPAPDFETVVEASYKLALSAKIFLQPDLQYIRHPGGSAAQRDALLFMLRLNASY